MANEELREKLNTLTLALNKNPNDIETCFEIGKIYSSLKNYEEAINFFKKALIINPKEISLHLKIGLTYSLMGDINSAFFHYEQILNHNDSSEEFLRIKAGAYLNIANIYYYSNEFDKSIEFLEKALAIDSDYSDVFVNLGNCYNYKNQKDKALYYFKKALDFNNNDLDAKYNLAFTQLSMGDFENGFANYECRILCPITTAMEYPVFKKPRWQGENLKDKTIFIHHEQGLGDAIQFARFFHELKQQGAKILYNAPETLIELFESSDFIRPEVVAPLIYKTDENFESNFDYYLPIMSLPYVLKTKQSSIPLPNPYFFANKEKTKKFQELLKEDIKIKIAISWKGNPNGDPKRIIKLKEFYTLCDIPNVSLYSFQKGSGQEELNDIPDGIKITDLGQHLNDFSDTAAALANMALLISNDSAMVHLGGAMGIKTCVLLPYFAEWRWGLNSNDTPWYKSVKLFRQKTVDNWTEVFQDVKQEFLNEFLPSKEIRL